MLVEDDKLLESSSAEEAHVDVKCDDENPIKSVAILKHQMVRSPANFAELKCNTNLNIPPTNWLNSTFNSYGFQQALSQSTGFSSFRMAHLFPDCVGEVDVVANAENIKCLLKLPYAVNSTISMMVHRIGNTLLIDEFDVHRFLLQQEDCDWQWLRSFIYENIISRSNDPKERNVPTKQTSPRNDVTQQRSLLSKFLYHSLSRTDETATSESGEQLNVDLIQPPLCLPFDGHLLPEPNIEENVPDPKHTTHTYNRNVVWTFEDIRMLIGTDMAIFGGSTRPCISLRLRDMRQPINVLTGIDYWLDNLMCNVPEVVMCYHLDGLVQKYEIIKTEDLPYLEGSTFSPKAVRNVAQNILSFLKQNATKSGHTYWLFKGRNDDVVKLYDLTSLCTTGEFDSEATPSAAKSAAPTSSKTDDKNPFTVPVAMLLYKVAKNMKNSAEHISAKQAGSIQALLDNCIKLLPKEQYPQIVTSSYYLLSDLHVPIGTDPMAPKFDNDYESDSQSVYDDDNNISEDLESNNADDDDRQTVEGNSIAVQSVVDATKESDYNQSWHKQNPLPQPLIGTIEERCTNALQYIAKGLHCLQYFSMTEEKLTIEREEIAKQTEKMRIIQEEQNPNMAKPYQAIPLPYETLSNISPTSDSVPERDHEDKENRGNASKNKRTKSTKKKSNSKISNASVPASVSACASKTTKMTDKKSLQKSHPSSMIPSWNVHLKLLLLEKACLIYAILTEETYKRGEYGAALRFIKLAMKCHHIVIKNMSSFAKIRTNYRSNMLARAGDCHFHMVANFDTIDSYSAQFKVERDEDAAIEVELQKDAEAIEDETKLPELGNDMEQLFLKSIWCYKKASQFAEGEATKREIIGREGGVYNELGLKYMLWSEKAYGEHVQRQTAKENETEKGENEVKVKEKEGDTETEVEVEVEGATDEEPENDFHHLTLAKKSYDCLIRAIELFDRIGYDYTVAICLGNLGRNMRLRAHIGSNSQFSYKKCYYENAFAAYERALNLIDSRKENPAIWDDITWNLSTAKFTLGKLMLENYENSLTDEIEQSIIELLLASLKLCDAETPSIRQIMYSIRSGLIYHHLGNIYSHSYKRETNSDPRKKKLLQLCRLYYEKGAKTFESIDAPTEFLAVQIDRLDLQNVLFEGCQTPAQKTKTLHTALSLACGSIEQLGKIEKLDDNNSTGLTTQLKQIEAHIQTILRQLIRLAMNKQSNATLIATYKCLYSGTLKSSVNRDNSATFAQHLKQILENILQSNVIQC